MENPGAGGSCSLSGVGSLHGHPSDLWEEGNAADSCLKVNSTSYLSQILNWEIMEGREESAEDAASASFCELRQGMLLLLNLSSP